MEQDVNKKQIIKDIILGLHHGLTVEEAKERFEREIGSISSLEIAEIEQSLINEGVSPDEIKKFCNVHALLFQSSLAKELAREEFSSHPVALFKAENREIERLTGEIKELIGNRAKYSLENWQTEIKDRLFALRGIKTHYERKELLLFPFLEKHGFTGPSKVMWGKDNEVRSLLKNAIAALEVLRDHDQVPSYLDQDLHPFIVEAEGMIFKEENILFPTAMEKLDAKEWVEILKESDEVGYVFIAKPSEVSVLLKEFERAIVEEPKLTADGAVAFPSGTLSLKELMYLLNSLPVDVSFVDKDDIVRYFSESKGKIFARARAVIGRKVQNCHPPQSVKVVDGILKVFREGIKDSASFWINSRGKLVLIKYFAVRDEQKNYLGTLEVTQDVSEIKSLQGERRLQHENY